MLIRKYWIIPRRQDTFFLLLVLLNLLLCLWLDVSVYRQVGMANKYNLVKFSKKAFSQCFIYLVFISVLLQVSLNNEIPSPEKKIDQKKKVKPLTWSILRMLVLVSNSKICPLSTMTLSPSCGGCPFNQVTFFDHRPQNWIWRVF